ncbi:MAG: glycoside hydrolase [Opitutaceae bacterium]|jgi:hypothetical protein|nr:glycoside hydrolase [Opitutaceae bacterium]
MNIKGQTDLSATTALPTPEENRNPELRRTRPDYITFIPSGDNPRMPDAANEHFLVFRRADDSLAAVWTQSGHEGQCNQHIAFAESDAHGKTWTKPRIIAGADFCPETGKGMCSWAFPLVSKTGRIYVLFSQHAGVNDLFTHTTGWFAAIFSDDNGATWSTPERVNLPRSEYDNPDETIPPSGIVWQKPLRFGGATDGAANGTAGARGGGRYLAGLTRWVSPSRMSATSKHWFHYPSVVDFLRFENIDDNPSAGELRVTLLTAGKSLRYPPPGAPDSTVLQEPTLNALPDGRLFTIMRTVAGHPAWSLSADGGETWTPPEPLRYGDGLPVIAHSISPCPCYTLDAAAGEYVFLYHNHDGHFGPWIPHSNETRRPIYLSFAKYAGAAARQPLVFSSPVSWFDCDGVNLNNRCDLAMYSSFEFVDGNPVIWYPDRKHYLLGKIIAPGLRQNAVFPPPPTQQQQG